MKNRALEITGFLEQAGWGEATQTPLQADFSTRRFARLEHNGKRAILMDADAEQKTEQFVLIAGLLRGCEISAPEIYAAHAAQGLVLMEDFGDRNIGRLIDAGADAKTLCRRAVDMLVHLHQRFNTASIGKADLPAFGGALFASQAELFLDAYVMFAKQREPTFEESESFRAAWKDVLKGIEALPQTLMLRDCMPDNLMDLSRRSEAQADWRTVGVLDFQDGGLGPIAYDIASLCEVVRRDAPPNMLDEMVDYYFDKAKPKLPKQDLRRTCVVLSAQRHIRILGIIARLALRSGRKEKLEYMPRIWKYLQYLTAASELKPFSDWLFKHGLFP